MIYELFVTNGFWFWALIAVFTVWIFASVKHESEWSWSVPIILALILWLFGNVNVFKYAWENPSTVGLFFLGYVVIGVLYSFVKWAAFVRSVADIYYRMKEAFIRNHSLGIKIDEPIQDAKGEWIKYLNDTNNWKKHSTKWVEYSPRYNYTNKSPDVLFPSVTDYKSKIIYWMTFWPFSLLWLILNDAIDRLMDAIFTRLRRGFQSISDKAFGGIIKELN